MGDPDRSTDWRQPGGWIYNVLPYIEQQALHDMGAGMSQLGKATMNNRRIATPLSLLYCPTRRNALTYPMSSTGLGGNYMFVNGGRPAVVARSDYAANSGDVYFIWYPLSGSFPPPSWPCAAGNNYDAGPSDPTSVENPPGQMTAAARTAFNNIGTVATGIVYVGSMVKMADIRDGTSNTYLLGEKYLDPDYYTTGWDQGDNECSMIGQNEDIARWSVAAYTSSISTPQQDTPGADLQRSFRQRHSAGCQMAFCDGSVQMIPYTIDPSVHRWLSDRADGQTINATAF